MAEVRYREVMISDVMNLISENHRYTKKFIEENKGEYPVYSATINEPYGFISSYDFRNKKVFCVVNYGNSGKTYLINDNKFSIGRNISALEVKKEFDGSVDLEYVRIVSESKFIDNAKGTKQKNLNQRLVKNTKIKIPIKEDGNYDIETQKEIVKKYKIVEEKKKELKEKLDYFKDVQVDFMATEISKYKEYKVSDIFDISLGDGKYTKSYSAQNIGEFPLYSGQTDGEYANINSYDYDGSYLTWAKDGLAGYMMHHDNEKFSITNHRGILLLKDEYSNLNLEFLKIILEPIFRKNIKGRLGTQEKNEYTTLSKEMIIDIKDKLKIPINEDGTFDLEKQKQIVSKYKAIEEMKNSILEKGLPFTLSNVQFDSETPYIYIYIRVRDLFDIQRGKSIYTKTYCKNNKGEYPVYSADNNNPLAYRNKYDYDGKYLSSSINGIAGVLTILDGKFSTNADRVVFIPKIENINLDYVKNILEPILRNKNKGRKGLKGKNEFTKLTPSMIGNEMIPIPYNIKGEPSLDKQKKLADKYKTINMIKNKIEKNFNELLRNEIVF